MRVLAPKPRPSRQPGADREHVLDRAADFDAGDVGGGVGAEVRRRQIVRQRLGVVGFGRGDRHRGRQARADLAREGRARQHRDRAAGPEHLARDLIGQQAAVELEALGGPAQPHRRRQQRLELLQQRAKGMARHGDQHVVDAGERGRRASAIRCRLSGKRRVRADSGDCGARAPWSRICARSRPHSRVGRPARANWMASAVPQEPAPSTAMSACAARLPRSSTAPSSWWPLAPRSASWRTARRNSPAAAAAAGSRPG